MENIVKGWFTSLLGAALMVMAVYEWWTVKEKQIYDWDILGPFIAGFALLYMKDKISEWIGTLFSAIIDKFKK